MVYFLRCAAVGLLYGHCGWRSHRSARCGRTYVSARVSRCLPVAPCAARQPTPAARVVAPTAKQPLPATPPRIMAQRNKRVARSRCAPRRVVGAARWSVPSPRLLQPLTTDRRWIGRIGCWTRLRLPSWRVSNRSMAASAYLRFATTHPLKSLGRPVRRPCVVCAEHALRG